MSTPPRPLPMGVALIGGLVFSAVLGAGAGQPDYVRDIKPLLRERCTSCHGGLKQKAGLRLDTVARMLAGDTVTEAARAAARALLHG